MRKRASIEARKGVRRIGNTKKDGWWTENPEESFREEESKKFLRRDNYLWHSSRSASRATG